jgi:translation initiation factor IF-1
MGYVFIFQHVQLRYFVMKENITVNGTIEESLSNGNFRVKLENGTTILAYLSGKMRINSIKVIIGDQVQMEMSPYDLTRGRISRRLSKQKQQENQE